MEDKFNEANDVQIQEDNQTLPADLGEQQRMPTRPNFMVNNGMSPYGISSYYVAQYPPLAPAFPSLVTSEPMRLMGQIPVQSASQLPPQPPLFAVTSSTFHPAQDPSELLRRFIRQNSPESDENPEFYQVPNDSAHDSVEYSAGREAFSTQNISRFSITGKDLPQVAPLNQNPQQSHHVLKPLDKAHKKNKKGGNKKHNKNNVYFVQFKYFCKEYVLGYGAPVTLKVGDKVIVATERGDDLGTIVEVMPIGEFYRKRHHYNSTAENNASGFIWSAVGNTNSGSYGTEKSQPIAPLTKSNSTESYNSISTISGISGGDSHSDTGSNHDNGSSDESYEADDKLVLNDKQKHVGSTDSNDHSVAPNSPFVRSLGRLLRLATDMELERFQQKTIEENEVVKYVQRLIDNSYHFKMHVMEAEYQFNMNKLTIYYTTEDNKRIDFRDMVKSIYTVYKVRIWMERV